MHSRTPLGDLTDMVYDRPKAPLHRVIGAGVERLDATRSGLDMKGWSDAYRCYLALNCRIGYGLRTEIWTSGVTPALSLEPEDLSVPIEDPNDKLPSKSECESKSVGVGRGVETLNADNVAKSAPERERVLRHGKSLKRATCVRHTPYLGITL